MEFYKDKFRRERKKKFLSQAAIAKLSGYSRKSIARWEKGETVPREGNIRKLAEVLDLGVGIISNLEPVHSKSEVDLTPLSSSEYILNNSSTKEHQRINSILSETMQLKKELEITSILINTILSATHFSFYIKDQNMKYISANSMFLESLSLYPELKILGKEDHDLFSKKEAILNAREDAKVLKTGRAIVDRESYIPGSRKKKWGLISKIPIFDSENNAAGVAGIFIDITERKKHEEKINALYHSLSNLSNDSGLIFGQYSDDSHSSFNIEFCSKNLLEFANLSEEHFANHTRVWEKLIHPDSMDYFVSENKRQWGKPVQNYELQFVNPKTHETKWFNYTYCEENNYGLCIFIPSDKDVAENELNSLLINILDSSENAVRIVQLKPHRYILFSKSAETLFGYSKDNFLNSPNFRCTHCVHPDDRDKENAIVNSNNIPKIRTYRIVRPSGKIVHIEETTIKMNYKDIDYILAISNEIRNLK